MHRPAPRRTREVAPTKKVAPAKPQDRTPGKHPQKNTGTASPGSRPRADEPSNKPVGGEHPPHAAPPAEQSHEDGSRSPRSTLENEPARAEASRRPDEGREPALDEGKAGNEEDTANDPAGTPAPRNQRSTNPRRRSPKKTPSRPTERPCLTKANRRPRPDLAQTQRPRPQRPAVQRMRTEDWRRPLLRRPSRAATRRAAKRIRARAPSPVRMVLLAHTMQVACRFSGCSLT